MIKFYVLAFCVLFASASPRKVDIDGRIIGGVNAGSGQFPFIAAIDTITPFGKSVCGGSLISDKHVLTAGQCVDGATAFLIHLGSSNYLLENDSTRIQLSTDIYVLHPDYNPQTLENDVGLIKFKSPIQLNDYIKPVDYLVTTPLRDSSSVLTMGWGQTSDGSVGLSEKLQYVYFTSLSNTECKIVYGNQITDGMVCVDGGSKWGTCFGDSGSPLVQGTVRGEYYQVGISSFFSGNGCQSSDPSGFTRTAPYVNWINNVTRST